MSKLDTAMDHITDSPYPFRGRSERIINDDTAVGFHQTRIFKPDCEIRFPAGTYQDQVSLNGLFFSFHTVMAVQRFTILYDLIYFRTALDIDIPLFQDRLQTASDLTVHQRQQVRLVFQDRYFTAQFREDRSHFTADHTAADDRQLSDVFRQVRKEPVAVDHTRQGDTADPQCRRYGTGSDQDILCAVFRISAYHSMTVPDHRMTTDHFHACRSKLLSDPLTQSGHDTVLFLIQSADIQQRCSFKNW